MIGRLILLLLINLIRILGFTEIIQNCHGSDSQSDIKIRNLSNLTRYGGMVVQEMT